MKTKLFTLLLAVAASIGTMQASDTQVDGIWYDFDSSTKTASVTYRGDSAYYYDNEYTGSVVIPASVTYNSVKYSVTSIGDDAFYNCSGLTSVTIPDSVTSIGVSAFYNCTGLTSVTIPNSVTSIGAIAFSGCSSLTSVTIPNSVTSIGDYAFDKKCTGLTSSIYNAHVFAYLPTSYSGAYTIPDGIESIAGGAFYNCNGLTSVTIPNSVTSIGSGAFSYCSGLTSVTVPNSVTSIGNYAFNKCTGLTSVTIPNSVTSIGESAFYGCTGLTSIEIPNSVTSIGKYAFQGCSGLTSVTIGNSVTSIEYGAFLGCSGLTSVTIPNSVTSIGNDAFEDCTGLTSVTIGNSVTSIGNDAFEDCTGLTSIEIPNSVTSIGKYAFQGCSGLTSVIWNAKNYADYASYYTFYDLRSQITSFTFGNEVEYIPAHLCNGMSNLTSVTIPNSVTSIGWGAFRGCTGLTSVIWDAKNCADSASYDLFYDLRSQITSFTFGNEVEHIPAYLCNGLSNLTSVTIPNSVTSIGYKAFRGCTGLTSVTIPNSVTSIGYEAFYGCSSLTSVTIPNSVTSIGVSAFYNCSGLTSVTIPDSVTSIGEGAFYNCSGLISVTIPNSVTSIGDSAFHACTGLTSVIWDAKNCSTSGGFGSQVTSFVFGNEVETIPADCCSGMNITSITIPNSVTSIGDYAFAWCTGLTAVTIPNSVTSIGDYAFYKCTGLTSPVYNAHVFAFMPTSYSGAYTIPDGIESIGDGAFQNCTGLTSVTIPNSVTSIGYKAFSDCSSLTAIYVPCGEMERFKQMLNNDSRINDHAPLPYTITINEEHGNVTYPQTMCDDMSLNATPDYGYHFVQWSDGNTDNPRTIVMTQDTTFTAEFAPDRVGTCGKDMALVWSYDPTNKVLTIGNAGSFTENMQFGAEAPNEMEELVIGNSVTAIGANAFAGIETLKKVSIGESVKTIGEQAFYNCMNLETIFNYRPTPTNTYSNTFDGVDKFECTLYVLPNSIDMYKNAAVWRDFYYTYAIGAEETTVTTNDVTVEPQDNAATLTWPTSNNAASYTIQITKDGVLFCTLIFNANGQLIGIAFAPGREGAYHAPAAIMTANGLQFTVTGLSSGTQYSYSVTAKDANDQTVATYSGEFTTTSEGIATGIDNIDSSSLQGGDRGRLILRDGQIFILRGDRTYTLTGQEVR